MLPKFQLLKLELETVMYMLMKVKKKNIDKKTQKQTFVFVQKEYREMLQE